MTVCSRSAAVLVAATLALPSPAALAQPAPARRMAAPPVETPAPSAAPAPAGRTGGPGPACNDVREDPQPYALAVGKTTRYRPASAVVRMVLDDQTSESGVPGALSPAAPAGGMPSPGPGSSTVVGLTARAPTNSQSVGTRPGVGEIAVRLLSPTDIYLTGKRIGAANVVMVHAGGSCTLLNVVVGMDPSGLQAAIDQLLPEERERVPEGRTMPKHLSRIPDQNVQFWTVVQPDWR